MHGFLMMSPFGKGFVFFVVVAAFVINLSSCSTVEAGLRRNDKRLIWGTPLTETKAYAVTSFFALLTAGSRFSYLVAKTKELFTGQLPRPTLSSMRCGGALITKNIVQTACHCYNHWLRINDSYHEARVINGWEHWASVFVGHTLIRNMREDGLWSKKFILHQQCAMVMYAYATHDYALVVLNKDVEFKLLRQSTAPVYSAESISNIYYRIMKQEAVCLHVGFGTYYFQKPGIGGAKSPLLQHGWRAVRPYWYCYWRAYLHSYGRRMRDYGMSYPQLATWICTQYFGKERGTPWGGDSGSPVTCNDIYVGVISFKDVLHKQSNVSTDFFGALAFSLYENAADYREAFIAKIAEYSALKEWPPDKPVNITQLNDWGSYFDPSGTLWILKRFDEKGAMKSKTDSSVSISKSNSLSRGGFASIDLVKFFHTCGNPICETFPCFVVFLLFLIN